nr:hypothetical protein [Tanacetum cinerariifolium]
MWAGAYVVQMTNHPYGFLIRSWGLCKVVGGLLRLVFQVTGDYFGTSLLTQIGMVDFVTGRAVIDAAHRKRVKYKAKCANTGYDFLPFSFSSLEELEKDAVNLLKRIRKFSVAQDIRARAVVHILIG